jgi:hypothetical protein
MADEQVQDQQQPPVADAASASQIKLDLSKSQPLPPAVTLDMSKSKPLTDANPAAQPGAIQSKKGGPVQNVNNMPLPNRADEVAAAQAAGHATASVTPGGELAVGAIKGLYETGLGGAKLLSKAANALGLHTDETDALAHDNVSAFSEAMTKPEGAGQTIGSLGEGIAEWAGGDEVLKGLTKLAKVPEAVLALAEKYPKIAKLLTAGAKGAAVGGVQGALKEGSVEGAEHGAEGGAIGGAAGELTGMVAKPILKAAGIGTSAEEDIMRAAQPGKRNDRFLKDWATAKDRIVEEVEQSGKFKDMGEAADRIGDVRRAIWTDEVMPVIEKHADEVFDTTGVANRVRKLADSPALQKNFPEDAKFLHDFADKYTSGTPLFSGKKTVAEAEKEIELYNSKLANEGYWKKTPKERAVMEKANPKIAAWRAASDEIRDGLYKHLGKTEEGIAALKNEYGAVGNIENEIRGQVNVSGRQRPLSLKQIVGLASGHPIGIASAFLDKIYNAPEELLNRAVSKSATPGPVKNVVQNAVKSGTESAGTAGAIAGSNLIRFIASDGSVHSVNADQLDAAKQIDPGLKVQE